MTYNFWSAAFPKTEDQRERHHPVPEIRIEEASHLRSTEVDEEVETVALSPAAPPFRVWLEERKAGRRV